MKKRILISICVIFALLVGGLGIYVSDYYRASGDAAIIFASGEAITKKVTVFRPAETVEQSEPVAGVGNVNAGLIFYPGGKVEASAYAPLLKELTDEGILCVLVEMPLNLAVLDSDAAEGIQEMFPEVEQWYLGGHSLGGAMAASYVAEHVDEFDGLVLLASYSTVDLTVSGLDVISIHGTEDLVLNRENYEEYRGYLPDETVEVVIKGGNHAQFGDYGPQEGDGEAKIDGVEQIEMTVSTIVDWIGRDIRE